ncbi:MAG TPA: hypothetical protein VJ909_00295 [Prolixibacteraceae bacterium]|nr:hypothetical protein [Prolixibacteraceae bacterium]
MNTYRILLLFIILFIDSGVFATLNHQSTENDSIKQNNQLLYVYLDCDRCDFNYIRQEITYVNYVRDPNQADIHVFVTDEHTGDGGRMFEFSFIGRDQFSGTSFERNHTISRNATDDDERKELATVLEQGLAAYMLQTNEGDSFSVSYSKTTEPLNGKKTHDPWNNWVFEAYLGRVELEMESNQSEFNSRWGLFADRVTEDWKIRIRPYFNFGQKKIQTSENEEPVVSTVFRSGLDSYAIKSLGDHWSAGVFGTYLTNNSRNIKHEFDIQPGIEYSLLPYEEATRRSFTIQYQVGYAFADYFRETVYSKTQESLLKHKLRGDIDIQQPWGNIEAGFLGSHYFHDIERSRFEFYGQISVRIIEGLSLSFQTDYSIVRDQLSLPKGGATLEEVLLQQRELATSYDFSTMIAITYLFGSKYANIVNTRF